MFTSSNDIENALQAVGELLEADAQPVAIVIIGGAALSLLGIVDRTTRDIDIVAVSNPDDPRQLSRPPQPLPEALTRAIAAVAVDFGLPPNWLNSEPAGQWDLGLPLGFAERVQWRRYGALQVGVSDRVDLIRFKLEAAADQPDANTRHFRDLLSLKPTRDELSEALEWVKEKNAGGHYHHIVDQVVAHALTSLTTNLKDAQ